MFRLLCFINIWMLGSFFHSFAQEVPRIINYTQTSRQALDKTWMIAQDSNHIMHFANNAGMITYDGTEWQNFSLPNNQIVRSIAIDKNGKIFTGGYGEFGFWDRNEAGKLTYFSLSDTFHYELAHTEEIWNIVICRDYVLLQSFSTIYLYNYHELKIISPPKDETIMFIHSVKGRNFLQVKNHGIYEVLGDGRLKILKGTKSLAQQEVVCILPYKISGLLIGTSLSGVFIWNEGKLKAWSSPTNSFLARNQLNRGMKLSGGAYAFGTILNGVYILNENGGLQWRLTRENGLQNNTILSMWEDNQQNLWLGLDKGIDLIELNSSLVFFPDSDGFLGTVYTATLFEGDLYLGTNHGVFRKKWKSDDKFSFIPGSQGQVWELKILDGQLICGHNEGTFTIEKGEIKRISPVTGGWDLLPFPGQKDKMIQSTYTGLVIYQKNQKNQWQFSHRLPGFRAPVRKIIFDQDGFLWALNPYKGLYRILVSPDAESITEIKEINISDGLPSEFNLDIEKIDDKVIIQSNHQFFFMDSKTNKLIKLDSVQNHDLNSSKFTIMHGQGLEWFKVMPGIAEWIHDANSVKIPVSLESQFASITALDSQYYLFGLSSGYALFDKTHPKIQPEEKSIKPLITSVCLVGNKSENLCFYPLNQRTIPELKHNQNYLRFSFAYPDFTHNALFRYHLEGFRNEDAEWTNENFKEYSNLDPGKYTFTIQSQLSEQSSNFSFIILPAWYQTIWAQIFFVLLILGVIILLGQYQVHRMEMRRKKEEKQRQKELERQLVEAKNEKLQMEVLGKSQELANSTMNLIRKNEILLELKNEFKKIRNEINQSLPYKYYKRILGLIDGNITNEYDWQVFETNFNQVHEQFFKRLKSDYPDLTPGDLQLAAFLRMNLTSKDIAPLLNISLRGVENKRYRLRKKMGLKPDDNLTELLIKY